jgi:putative PIN family toxin of toxin-antitoxin system
VTRVLFDTNIWVSAFLAPGGHCGRLVHRVLGAAGAEVIVSAPLLDELVDVLGRPRLVRRYGFTAEEVREYIEWIGSIARMVEPTAETYGCRDPKDDFVCGTAVAGTADHLATRDDDLKRGPALMSALARHGVRITSVAEMNVILDGATGSPG